MHAIQTTFYSTSGSPQDICLLLQPEQELNEPDLLLYWAATAPQGNSLPKTARLVGAFAKGKVFPFAVNDKRAGYLILFSQAHQTVFDTASVETLP